MKSNKNKKMEINNRIIYSIIIIIVTLCLIFGISFAVFSYREEGEQQNEVGTGTLIVTLDDSTSSGILIEDALPTIDAVGKSKVPYTFTIENEGTINSNYRIRLINDVQAISEDGCSGKLLNYSQVKYNLIKNGEDQGTYFLNNDSNGIIDLGTMEPKDKNTYELRLWIDINISKPEDVNGKHLHVKVEVDAIQDKYFDFDDID